MAGRNIPSHREREILGCCTEAKRSKTFRPRSKSTTQGNTSCESRGGIQFTIRCIFDYELQIPVLRLTRIALVNTLQPARLSSHESFSLSYELIVI